MKPDDFEKQLQGEPLRTIPATWRKEILAAARSSACHQLSTRAPRRTSWWREWLWPSPWAWAAGAAVWVFILGFQLATVTTKAPASASRPLSSPAGLRMVLVEQWRWQAELFDLPAGPLPPAPPKPAKRLPLRPQSRQAVPWPCA